MRVDTRKAYGIIWCLVAAAGAVVKQFAGLRAECDQMRSGQ